VSARLCVWCVLSCVGSCFLYLGIFPFFLLLNIMKRSSPSSFEKIVTMQVNKCYIIINFIMARLQHAVMVTCKAIQY
jgi:hypothetical protein